MRNIAVIPARAGSKGLKDKNIMNLGGKPLLVHSIEVALKTNKFDVVHVSTDSDVYAEIAKENGADVPFLRDESLAGDKSSTWDVMRFVVEEYKKRGMEFDTLTVLQPTSPLRQVEDVVGAINTFEEKSANFVSTVCEMDHSPLWSNILPEDHSLENFEDEEINSVPRQSLPIYYRENGAVYVCRIDHLFKATNIYKPKSFAYIMKKEHSIDIDDEFDFRLAEFLMGK